MELSENGHAGFYLFRMIRPGIVGMCDPLIDISMCAIYVYYTEEQMNQLAELYLERPADDEERMVIYSYAALCGFLWKKRAASRECLLFYSNPLHTDT